MNELKDFNTFFVKTHFSWRKTSGIQVSDHTFAYVSGGKKCCFLGKLCVCTKRIVPLCDSVPAQSKTWLLWKVQSIDKQTLSIFLEWLWLHIVERVQNKECYNIFPYTFWYFFVVFYQKTVFLSFLFLLFWWRIKITQEDINQSETGIDGTETAWYV